MNEDKRRKLEVVLRKVLYIRVLILQKKLGIYISCQGLSNKRNQSYLRR